MAYLLIIHGPNLNLLGMREPEKYGHTTLAVINARLQKLAQTSMCRLETYQSNAEHELINRIHSASQEGVNLIIINPAAYTHSSIALRDALLAVAIPFIEVHLSNIYARESFRQHSYFSDIAIGVITGFGPDVYELAFTAALQRLTQSL